MFDMSKVGMMLLCMILLAFPVQANTKDTEGDVRESLAINRISAYLQTKTQGTEGTDAAFGLSENWHKLVEEAAIEGEDITTLGRIRVSVNGNDLGRLTDDRYKTYWNGEKNGWIEFILPEESPCYGLYIKWAETLAGYVIEQMAEDETWTSVGLMHEAVYYNEYIPINGLTHFRIRNAYETLPICVTEVQMLGAGSVPDWVELWQPFEGEADLLLLSAHPDDEMLWFGGTIPYYRSERCKKVLVVNVSQQPASRKCELLDCLWTCGVREYPILTGGNAFLDRYASQVRDILKLWGEENLLQFITGVIRQYRPLVAVTHGFNGEYGHGAHKTCAYALTKCLELAADPEYVLSGEAAALEPWQIQKVYIHLYEENPIEMDWRQPLKAFGGKTGFEVACEAFRRHRTQDTGKYVVEDYGKYNNSRFGLYFSAVGSDVAKNDFFENISEERGAECAE